MESVAIISEYNPFHNGHLYQINQIKKIYPNHVIIAIMSGQFVQRGEPAFFNKFIRTKMALQACDLVVELPQFYAMSYADDFAYGGVQIAKSLQADVLSFGSEIADINQLNDLKNQLQANQKNTNNKLSYATRLLDPSVIQSNTILALQYMIQLEKINANIALLPIERIQNQYNDRFLTGHISSATAIRNELLKRNDVSHTVPNPEFMNNKDGVTLAQFYPYIRYSLIQKDTDELIQIYTMYEGLENRLKQAAINNESFDTFFKAIQTKRYTNARLQRILLYILFNIQEKDKNKFEQFNHIRVLGMNDKGQAYIKSLKQSDSTINFATNINKSNKIHFDLEIKATQLYNMVAKNKENDFNTPVIR